MAAAPKVEIDADELCRYKHKPLEDRLEDLDQRADKTDDKIVKVEAAIGKVREDFASMKGEIVGAVKSTARWGAVAVGCVAAVGLIIQIAARMH